MLRSRPSPLVVTSLLAVLVACSDPAGPGHSPSVAFTGPATARPRAGSHPDGTPRVECEATIAARLASRDAADRARWSGGTLRWTSTNGVAVGTPAELPAAELAQLWGHELAPDAPVEATVRFWSEEPFGVVLDARYTVGDDPTQRSATYALRCEPPAPPLTGRWALTTIDGRRLPTVLGVMGMVVTADTLEFFPNLTYASHAVVGAGETRVLARQPYEIPHADSVALPYFLQHAQAWTASRSETTLLFTAEGSGGGPPLVVRFDRVGSTPDLPPEPRFAAAPSTAALSAVSGGTRPEPLRIAVTSTAPTQLYGVSWTGEGTCVVLQTRTICPFSWLAFDVERSVTPTTLVVTAFSTDLPPGVYGATIYLTGINVPRLAVPVTYTVRAP